MVFRVLTWIAIVTLFGHWWMWNDQVWLFICERMNNCCLLSQYCHRLSVFVLCFLVPDMCFPLFVYFVMCFLCLFCLLVFALPVFGSLSWDLLRILCFWVFPCIWSAIGSFPEKPWQYEPSMMDLADLNLVKGRPVQMDPYCMFFDFVANEAIHLLPWEIFWDGGSLSGEDWSAQRMSGLREMSLRSQSTRWLWGLYLWERGCFRWGGRKGNNSGRSVCG